MASKILQFLEEIEEILLYYLDPLELAKKLNCFAKTHGHLLRVEAGTKRRCEFMKLLKEEIASDERVYQSFLEALSETPTQKWLYELLFAEPISDIGKLSISIVHMEKKEELRNFLHTKKDNLSNLNSEELILSLDKYFPDHERDHLRAIVRIDGNTIGLWHILNAFHRKDPECIEAFKKYCKEINLAQRDGRPLAEFARDLPTSSNSTEENVAPESSSSSMEVSCSEPGSSQTMGMNVRSQKIPAVILNENEKKNPPMKVAKKNENEISQSLATEDNPVSGLSAFPLRNYQKELLEKCIDKNVIVCSPPGSGKTLVAAYLIDHALARLSVRSEDRNRCKIIFFAPTVGLVGQQYQKLQEYLGNEVKVSFMHGSMSDEFQFKIDSFDVLCSTPQIMLNAVWDEKVKMNDFCLFVFDECHHCVKMQQYNKFMVEYVREKLKNKNRELPKVVGFTATLGIGRTTNTVNAKSNVMQLCANLDAFDGIITVTEENELEMRQFIPVPEEETIPLPPFKFTRFSKKLEQTMSLVVNILKDLNVEREFVDRNLQKIESSNEKTASFTQSCKDLEKLVEETELPNARDVLFCIECLLVCNKALQLQLRFHPTFCVAILQHFCEHHKRNPGMVENETEEKVINIVEENLKSLELLSKEKDCENIYLDKIKNPIMESFRKESNSRVMILVEEREHTMALKTWIDSNEDLKKFKADIFVGTANNKKSSIKMNYVQQMKVLKAFEEGEHKILIATADAVGEGVDIEKCNLVLTYDYNKSEIGMVQQKGRARATDGKIVNLSSEKTVEKDKLSLYKIMVMKAVEKMIQNEFCQHRHLFQKEICELQKKTVIEYSFYVVKKMQQLTAEGTIKEFKLRCRKCRKQEFSSNDIRRVCHVTKGKILSHGAKYINVNEEFKNLYECTNHPRPKSIGPGWEKCDKIACKCCSKPWGIIARYKGIVRFPLLKMDGFQIVDPMNRSFVQSPSKWQDACFTPTLVDSVDDLSLKIVGE